jgi:hypothetical protein
MDNQQWENPKQKEVTRRQPLIMIYFGINYLAENEHHDSGDRDECEHKHGTADYKNCTVCLFSHETISFHVLPLLQS